MFITTFHEDHLMKKIDAFWFEQIVTATPSYKMITARTPSVKASNTAYCPSVFMKHTKMNIKMESMMKSFLIITSHNTVLSEHY